jgi:NADPH:quinone reductase-like Zn-dependent oxidoreductase
MSTANRVVYLEPNKLTIESIALPPLQPNQVLVRTHQASICGSERYHYRGIHVRPRDAARGMPGSGVQEGVKDYPMGPLGHKGGGTIVEAGSAVDEYLGGGKVRVGDRVGNLVYPTYFDLDVILAHSDRYTLDELPQVFAREAQALDQQRSLKTIITP